MDAPSVQAAQCRRVPPEAIYDLRMRVIITGTDRHTVVFDGDGDPATIHYGRYTPHLVCCASLMLSEWQGEPAYQLRGMATEPAQQRQGHGARLLEAIEADIRAHESPRILWCNARTSAVSFYQKAGWLPVSGVFDIPGVGPHRQLVKRLG